MEVIFELKLFEVIFEFFVTEAQFSAKDFNSW